MDRQIPEGIWSSKSSPDQHTSIRISGLQSADLETDASLQGLGAVFSQRDEHGWNKVIASASQSLHPNARKMMNYSLAKLDLLALKWAMTEKLWDYLLGSTFTIYMDNNPLAYLRESKLEVAQIRWLSELALFDFDNKYRTGKLNKAADALSHHPYVSEEVHSNSGQKNMRPICMK